MPDAKAIEAATHFVDAFKALLVALGIWWSLGIGVLLVAAIAIIFHLRTRRVENGWKAALAAKDKMIDQINEQNRECRVQLLVVGEKWTKEEAVRLVYREDVLKRPPSDKNKAAGGEGNR